MASVDFRRGGHPHVLLADTPLMLVPPEIRECVAFTGYRTGPGTMRLCGTGFFVGMRLDDLGVPGHFAAYFVTAQHVVDGIRDKGLDRGVVRLNMTGGGVFWVEIPLDEFIQHPSHPDQEAVDVAVARVGLPDEANFMAIPSFMFATPDIITKHHIGVGDEVFVTGLFINHAGKGRNLPIIRVGNIAAMPEEPVATKFGEIEAYLVEARSIGGLSGSPVFVHLGATRIIDGQVRFASKTDHGIFYLIGVMHGHWEVDGRLDVDSIPVEDAGQRATVNMGIAIVSPVQKIVEILASPQAEAHRRDIAQRTLDAQRAQLPVMDSGNAEPS